MNWFKEHVRIHSFIHLTNVYEPVVLGYIKVNKIRRPTALVEALI